MGDNYTFTCHHGEKECVGNKVQACALKLIPATPDMDLQVKYINCLMAMAKSSVDMYPTKSVSAVLYCIISSFSLTCYRAFELCIILILEK